MYRFSLNIQKKQFGKKFACHSFDQNSCHVFMNQKKRERRAGKSKQKRNDVTHVNRNEKGYRKEVYDVRRNYRNISLSEI